MHPKLLTSHSLSLEERSQGNEDLSEHKCSPATAVFMISGVTVFITCFYADFQFTTWIKVTDFEGKIV